MESPHTLSTVVNNNRTINWDSNAVRNLTTKGMEAAKDILTTLTQMQGTQLVRTVSPPPPPYTATDNSQKKC